MRGRKLERRLAALGQGLRRVLLWAGCGLVLGAAVGLALGLVRAGAAGIAHGILEGVLAGLCVGAWTGMCAPGRTVKGGGENGRPEDEDLYFN